MRITTIGLAQAAGFVVGIAFMAFAVKALDLSAKETSASQVESGWAVAPAHETMNPASDKNLRTHVSARVEAFRTAMVAGDVLTLQALTDDSLSFGHSNGHVQTKAQFLEMIGTGAEIFKTLKLVDRNLEISGNTAVERHVFESDILIDGQMISVTLGILEVWRNNGGAWQLVARQAYKT